MNDGQQRNGEANGLNMVVEELLSGKMGWKDKKKNDRMWNA